MVKANAAEAEISQLLVLRLGQAPKTLDPTLLTMQLIAYFWLDAGKCLVNVFQAP